LSSIGPRLPFSDELHAQKYRSPGETFREAANRIANALGDSKDHFHQFRDILLGMRFLPAGRVQAAMGSTKVVTPYNCFVSGTIEDSFVEGSGSIMERATQAAQTMRMGGGIGYDFSSLRPRGADIRKLGSKSSGPVSFMEIYDAICRCVASSGHRRGAQMGVMRIDHPDIEEFIHAKQNQNRLTGFNVSVAVTDEFMWAMINKRPFELRFDGKVYRTVDPTNLWDMLMRSTWDWAEPGVLFIDRINEMNNLYYCENIAATNPCGEQPLPPFGACLLGSFNLTRYLKPGDFDTVFDWDAFRADIPVVVRAMDNVVDRAIYPLPQQREEARSKRLMGLGLTGTANALEACGFPYGGDRFLRHLRDILATLRDEAYRASVKLAKEKGPFPLFDRRYCSSNFIKTLPENIQVDIYNHGIRNSHLTSIAPTGTISLAADNISSGIEPVFHHEIRRRVFMEDGQREEIIPDYGVASLGVYGKPAAEVSIAEHLKVLTLAAAFVDSSVSKTLNVPADTPWDQFKEIYMTAWMEGAKGCTTFTQGGKRQGVLEAATPKAEACTINPETGERSCE